jgi:hypothetical protein
MIRGTPPKPFDDLTRFTSIVGPFQGPQVDLAIEIPASVPEATFIIDNVILTDWPQDPHSLFPANHGLIEGATIPSGPMDGEVGLAERRAQACSGLTYC